MYTKQNMKELAQRMEKVLVAPMKKIANKQIDNNSWMKKLIEFYEEEVGSSDGEGSESESDSASESESSEEEEEVNSMSGSEAGDEAKETIKTKSSKAKKTSSA